MPKWKRIIPLFLSAVLLFLSLVFPSEALPAEEKKISVSAEGAILLDADHGTVLYKKNADAPLPMASTTKIMTALVAILHSDPAQTVVIPKEAVGVEGSSIYLVEYEKLTLEELLWALLLNSANDAAVAIAIAVAGSVPDFARLMNDTAAQLGLTHTHFTNPHGLDDPEHYTSASDLAKITAEALKLPLFRQIVSTRKKTIPHNSVADVRLLINHNKLLRLYDGAIGVKTGFTKRSGRCLVSAAQKNGVTLICVTLNDPDDWRDHTNLLDHGFSGYEEICLCDPGAFSLSLPVVGGTANTVTAAAQESLTASLPSCHGEIRCTVEARRFLFAPVAEGETVGIARYYSDLDGDGSDEFLGEVTLTLQTGAEALPIKKTFRDRILSLLGF